MMMYFSFRSRKGEFRIVPGANGWQCHFEDEFFDGPFPTPQSAAEDIANGHTAWPSCGDPSRLGVPDDLSAWRCVRR